MRIVPTFALLAVVGLLSVPLLAADRTATATIVTPTFMNFQGPAALTDDAGEPSIGYNVNGKAAMFQSYTKTFRVTFNDTVSPPTATWVNKKSPYSVINVDPILFTDPVSGRTFAGGLDGECSVLSYTDDNGNSWTPMTNSCASPSWDHETIGGGSWKNNVTPLGATHNRAVYYCAQFVVAQCATSMNGGLSFGAGYVIPSPCGSLHGHVKVGGDGNAYLPFSDCGGRAGLGFTVNNGLTWSSRQLWSNISNVWTPASGFDPSIAAVGNRIYYAWQGQNNNPMVAVSDDAGLTWYNAKNLATTFSPNIIQSTFQAAVAGDKDRAAVAFLGSSTSGNPFASSWNGVWDLYVSFTYDGGATWTTVKATTDPVQRGWMCAGGTTCGSGRNLLDFMDATIDEQGRVLVAYADGCISTCAGPTGTKAQSTSERGTIARQSGGTSLYSAYD